jgi:Protein of unknown function (DUF3105)
VWESVERDGVLAFHAGLRQLIFLSLMTFAALLAGVAEASSCGGQASQQPDASRVIDAGAVDEPYFPEASCFVRIDDPPLEPGIHVPIGSVITTWDSNPPSSGEHYPIWAAYQEYDAAVPRGYYVHDLEHGAIDYLYNCALLDGGVDGGCDAIVSSLEQAVATMPDDPLCTAPVRVRFVLTPDPLIDYPVAAVAWGFTYQATCVDLPTLQAFASAHYAQGPEDFCTDGITGF